MSMFMEQVQHEVFSFTGKDGKWNGSKGHERPEYY